SGGPASPGSRRGPSCNGTLTMGVDVGLDEERGRTVERGTVEHGRPERAEEGTAGGDHSGGVGQSAKSDLAPANAMAVRLALGGGERSRLANGEQERGHGATINAARTG